MWIIQERITKNGIVHSTNLIKDSRLKMEETLREIAYSIAERGFVLIEQNEDCFVFEKDGEKYTLSAYEAEPLEKAEGISVSVYHLRDNFFLEVMRDETMGKAMVFVYNRDKPAAKFGAVRSDMDFSDEKIIAASVSAVSEILKKYEKRD